VVPRAIRAEGGQVARLERYELIAELAAGGMATVLLARLSGAGGFQRLFAIKRLHPHLAHEQDFVQMFLDEARLAARIHHPNVVPILEVGTSEAGYYLVMEYIEGETLARLLTTCAQAGLRVPPRIALRIIQDVLAGLDAAHELRDDDNQPLNIVHRDVSPQNVMVGVQGTSRITDFGVAHAASRLSNTRDGQLKGKLGYMAPEQARGEAIDRRADVFAVGVVLWEALAGRRLFKSKVESNDADTLNRLLFEPIPALLQEDASIDPAVAAVCEKALHREPDGRFATCAQFQDALEAAAQRSCGVASPREVAAFVESTAGSDIAAQRAALKLWSSQSEISRIARAGGDLATLPNVASYPSISSPSSASSPGQRPDPSSSSVSAASAFTPAAPLVIGRNRALAIGLLAGMLLLAVPLGLAVVLRPRAPAAQPPEAPTASVPSAPAAPQPAASASAAASTASSAEHDAATPEHEENPSARSPRSTSSGPRQTAVDQPPRAAPKVKPPAPANELEHNPYR
jgi:serine/threonine-protein kinase